MQAVLLGQAAKPQLCRHPKRALEFLKIANREITNLRHFFDSVALTVFVEEKLL